MGGGAVHLVLMLCPAAWEAEGRPWSPTPHGPTAHQRTPRGGLPALPTHQDRLLQATLGCWTDIKSIDLRGFCGFKMQLCGVRTDAARATTSQRWPTALNWRDYEKVCKKTRRYTVKPSCSQIWESFVEKSQSQLPLGLAEEAPTQEERAGTEWPSWGSPSLHAGSLWLYPVRKSLTTFF